MRLLILAGIVGFSCWIASEVIELSIGGYSPPVYYLTAGYHLFAGFGIWGLHTVQTKAGKSLLSLYGAAATFLTYIAISYFPIQVMNSGLSITEFIDQNPLYKGLGGLWFLGMMAFGVSVLQVKHFPAWTAIVILIGTLVFTATPLLGWPASLANVSNMLFAATVIFMCLHSLGPVQPWGGADR